MTIRNLQVELALQMHTGTVTAQVLAELRYDPADPYAVSLTFDAEGGRIEWIFARELMLEGVSEPVGDGDVRVSPAEDGTDAIMIALSSPTGRARFRAESRVIVRFLQESLDIVPMGEETGRIDWDTALTRLRRGSAGDS